MRSMTDEGGSTEKIVGEAGALTRLAFREPPSPAMRERGARVN